MKHQSTTKITYGPVHGIAGVDTLSAMGLCTGFDRHFHDTYSFGLILGGVERCDVRRSRQFFEPGTVPMGSRGQLAERGGIAFGREDQGAQGNLRRAKQDDPMIIFA